MSNEKMRTIVVAGDVYVNAPDLRAMVLAALDEMIKPPVVAQPLPVPTPEPEPEPEAPIKVPVPEVPTPIPTPTPTPPAIEPALGLTYFDIENLSDEMQTRVPFTAGQVFGPGELPFGDSLDGLQLDVKVTHPDGSVRHAIVSGVIASMQPGEIVRVPLVNTDKATTSKKKLRLATQAVVRIKLDGVVYTATNSAISKTPWLDGNVVIERHASASFTSADGMAHPHLVGRFAMRAYDDRTRADITIENNWAYEPNPQNLTYDVEIEVAGKVVYEQKNFTHYHHARWRKMFWDGQEPQIHIKHDTAYLIASRALPNYDQSVVIAESELATIAKRNSGKPIEPMNVGLSVRAMGTTGGRDDIALLPSWAVSALLTMDKRALDATHKTADLAGSWSMHYRDKDTDQPISLIDYPYMTNLGNPGDTYNPATKKREAFPKVEKGNDTPLSHDSSHQPNFSYLSYLISGDHYYLEEIQFWAMWNVFSSNPGFRGNIKGLVERTQVRGQAWSLRSIAEAAYITPDNDRLKEHFKRIFDANIDWYVAKYSPGGDLANPLGVLINGGAVVYRGKKGVAPWQDGFFTQTVGHAAELHPESRAKELLAIKVRFVEQRLLDANWLAAASYSYPVRAVVNGPILTIGEAYKILRAEETDKKEAARLDSGGTDLGGYPTKPDGYPAYMQPEVSYASPAAWAQFMKANPKPNFAQGAQFAILPRVA